MLQMLSLMVQKNFIIVSFAICSRNVCQQAPSVCHHIWLWRWEPVFWFSRGVSSLTSVPLISFLGFFYVKQCKKPKSYFWTTLLVRVCWQQEGILYVLNLTFGGWGLQLVLRLRGSVDGLLLLRDGGCCFTPNENHCDFWHTSSWRWCSGRTSRRRKRRKKKEKIMWEETAVRQKMRLISLREACVCACACVRESASDVCNVFLMWCVFICIIQL